MAKLDNHWKEVTLKRNVALVVGSLILVIGCGESDDPVDPRAAGAGGTGGNGGSTGGSGGASGSSGGSGASGAAGAGGNGGVAGSGGSAGAGGSGAGGAGGAGAGAGGAGACQLAPAPMCNTMTVPAAATFVTGTVGAVPSVSGGGVIPPGTFYLIKQIVMGGTPINKKIAVSGDGTCFVAIEVNPDGTELRLSGTATYSGEVGTTSIMCPITVTVMPKFQVLAPINGKVHYATLAPGGMDYREWLQD